LFISFIKCAKQKHSQFFLRSALGVKFWDGAGISFKHFFQGNNAGEFIGYFWNHGFRLTGLYEIHGNFADAQG
jgi:hypothetical protein